MDILTTDRGFQRVDFKDANGQPCSLQQSSAIGDSPGAMEHPGSSMLWLGRDGDRMHLTRAQVDELISLLSVWCSTGKLAPATTE